MLADGGGGQVVDAAATGAAQNGIRAIDPEVTAMPASTRRIDPRMLTSSTKAASERITNP